MAERIWEALLRYMDGAEGFVWSAMDTEAAKDIVFQVEKRMKEEEAGRLIKLGSLEIKTRPYVAKNVLICHPEILELSAADREHLQAEFARLNRELDTMFYGATGVSEDG